MLVLVKGIVNMCFFRMWFKIGFFGEIGLKNLMGIWRVKFFENS